MMEMNGLTSSALAATAVPIVAAAAALPKENGHGLSHLHHGVVEADPIVVSMKLADPVQVHLNHQENGVTPEMLSNVVVNSSVMSVVNPTVTSAGLVTAQQIKPPTAAVATTTTDGGGGLLAVVAAKEAEATGTAIINTTVTGAISAAAVSSASTTTANASSSGGYENKLFVGGLSWQTSSEKLREYFSKFGSVLEVQVVVDPMTQRSRGFGFITFADADTVRKIVAVPNHILDGKRIDPKHATPRNKQVPTVNSYKTKKIFVGGVSQDTTLDEIKAYFSQFGKVEDAVMLMDQQTMRHRGFGFVTFESDEVVERICEIHYHTIKDKKVECKKAKPKEAQQTVAVTGLHAFGGDHAAAAAAAHHLSLATSAASALGAQRTAPSAAAAYAAFYGGHLGMTGTPGGHPSQASIGNLAAASGLGIIPAGTAISAPGPVTYSSIRSGLARYTPYPVRAAYGNSAASAYGNSAASAMAASAMAAAVAPPPPPPPNGNQLGHPSTIMTSLSAVPTSVQGASPFQAYHHTLTTSGTGTQSASVNSATLDFGLPAIPTAVAAPSIHPTFDWSSGLYHV